MLPNFLIIGGQRSGTTSFFAEAPSSADLVGEASPGYICKPEVPRRIHGLLPSVKLVAVLRNPEDRAYSQYWDNRRFLAEPLSFEQAMEVALTPEYRHGQRGYFSRGAYINQIESYLELFKREFDFLCPQMTRASNPSMVWDNPLHAFFLRRNQHQKWVPRHWIKLLCRGKLAERKYPPMSRAARERLLEFYRPFNRRLEEFLGRDLDGWNR